MTLLKDSATSNILLIESDTHATPASGQAKLYRKTDNKLYVKDDAGVETEITTGGGAGHVAVTLDADAAVLLDLSTQEIGLDTQTANTIFAGPTTGAANEPTFRALVQADMPTQYTTLNFIMGDGTNEIADGVQGDIYFEAAWTISAWTLLANASGAIKVDLWMDAYANFPPTNDDTITNAHEPEIAASGVSAQDTDLSDWGDVTIAAGQSIRVNVDSCTTIARCTLALKLLRS